MEKWPNKYEPVTTKKIERCIRQKIKMVISYMFQSVLKLKERFIRHIILQMKQFQNSGKFLVDSAFGKQVMTLNS
jgi:hypothetical protein